MDLENAKDIAELKSDIKHINIHIEGIKSSMAKIQELILEQNDMRNELSACQKEHAEIKQEQRADSRKIASLENNINEIKQKVDGFSSNIKVNIFDYIWKYAALAIGAWIILKVTNILP